MGDKKEVENSKEKICPILTMGWLVNKAYTEDNFPNCLKEKCAL